MSYIGSRRPNSAKGPIPVWRYGPDCLPTKNMLFLPFLSSEVVSEEIISGEFDGLFWGDEENVDP